MARPDPSQFQYQHMPGHLAQVSRPFAELAGRLASTIPVNPDSDAALAKLLEARDLALRAIRHSDPETSQTQPELDFGEGAGPAFEATHGRSLDPG